MQKLHEALDELEAYDPSDKLAMRIAIDGQHMYLLFKQDC